MRFLSYFSLKYYLSFFSRLRNSKLSNALPDISVFDEKIALIIQGPIIEREEFTLETIKIYKKRFPELMIILSTWDDSPLKAVGMFKKLGVEVLLNKKPAYAGISNINLQIASTKNGIIKAKQKGAEYCFKMRTDQRIYRHDFISFFLSLLKEFPITNNKIIRGRLIAPSLNTYKYRLYGVTDMLLFGFIEDMLLYWDVEYDFRKKEEIKFGITVEEWAKANVCEVYLCTKYLAKIGHTPIYTLKDSWEVIADYFCIVDNSSIDLFWNKYSYWNEQRTYSNMHRSLKEEFTFSDWLNAKNNLSIYSIEFEKYLNYKNMTIIH